MGILCHLLLDKMSYIFQGFYHWSVVGEGRVGRVCNLGQARGNVDRAGGSTGWAGGSVNWVGTNYGWNCCYGLKGKGSEAITFF